ncbi:hypothetical protein RSAG8_09909, partial [Rhizoctonia solani AG-8 WAC10335]
MRGEEDVILRLIDRQEPPRARWGNVTTRDTTTVGDREGSEKRMKARKRILR